MTTTSLISGMESMENGRRGGLGVRDMLEKIKNACACPFTYETIRFDIESVVTKHYWVDEKEWVLLFQKAQQGLRLCFRRDFDLDMGNDFVIPLDTDGSVIGYSTLIGFVLLEKLAKMLMFDLVKEGIKDSFAYNRGKLFGGRIIEEDRSEILIENKAYNRIFILSYRESDKRIKVFTDHIENTKRNVTMCQYFLLEQYKEMFNFVKEKSLQGLNLPTAIYSY